MKTTIGKRRPASMLGGKTIHRTVSKQIASGPMLLDDRAAGVLLHLTSLPGPHGSGDLGRWARGFADFLSSAGQRWWQMLPVTPPGAAPGYSPYSSDSALAGSPYLV
ncbi:MAG TPA: 4-alpha-glucanotransferase, partial [Tepidisphaeraceae bacterium]|nr:4-alpha-glucanotransferase [Tepidisphaeraceae bacterium]